MAAVTGQEAAGGAERGTPEAAASVGYIVFRCGPETLGFPLTAVREIIKLQEASVTPLYRVEPCVLGLVNVRGQIMPVIDLSTLLELSSASVRASSADDTRSALIISCEGKELVVVVHRIIGVQWAQDGQTGAAPPLTRRPLCDYLTATLRTGRQPVAVLDPALVLGAECWERYR